VSQRTIDLTYRGQTRRLPLLPGFDDDGYESEFEAILPPVFITGDNRVVGTYLNQVTDQDLTRYEDAEAFWFGHIALDSEGNAWHLPPSLRPGFKPEWRSGICGWAPAHRVLVKRVLVEAARRVDRLAVLVRRLAMRIETLG
jgi:hypothetical protein